MKNRLGLLLLLLALYSCAGWARGCASLDASSFGANWIILQYDVAGNPINCWKLKNTSVDNEPGSDGIYWLDPSGHLVHISGWYNRVQVKGTDMEGAAALLGIDLAKCVNGRYEK